MPKTKWITSKEYLARFRFAARWYLQAKDADEVTADYRELLDCGKDVPADRFGSPAHAARLLADKREYIQWVTAFAAMAACAVWLFGSVWTAGSLHGNWLLYTAAGVGLLLSAGWFRLRGHGAGAVPARLKIVLAAILLGTVALTVYVAGVLRYSLIHASEYGESMKWMLLILYSVMQFAAIVLVLAAVGALTAARCCDRRWSAVYVLALTLLLILALVLKILHQLNDPEVLPWIFLKQIAPAAVAGLVGTGVCLC